MAAQFNLTINDRLEFPEPHEPSIDGNTFPELVARSYVDTRGKIYCISLWLLA